VLSHEERVRDGKDQLLVDTRIANLNSRGDCRQNVELRNVKRKKEEEEEDRAQQQVFTSHEAT
jgi:hypothetical protein